MLKRRLALLKVKCCLSKNNFVAAIRTIFISSYVKQVTDVTEGDMHYYYEAFHEFDKHAEGYISASELGSLMRALGENPTSMELEVR